MTTQNQVIIEDLKEFVEKKSDISIKIYPFYFRATDLYFICDEGWINHGFSISERLIPLSDPQYREKFLAHLKDRNESTEP